ncbi:DNA-binding response regulator [Micrococcus luteus]|uniref:DNA-binding response regulator n=1 Tax=Micrococcus luteus TaxID=1270 RepID=A0AAP3AIK7_MICLU|nr:DNA-binding response regulator [Micrococcus luteus]
MTTTYNSPSSRAAMTADAARDLTDQIKTGMESVYHLIRAAYRGRAWQALGFGSWDEYVTREFGNLHLRPPLEYRQDVVLSLREAGMSTRAIASATQLSKDTVRRELNAATGANAPVMDGVPVVGMNGKTYQPTREPRPPAADTVAPSKSQVDLDSVLDMPAEDFGIEPLDLARHDEEQKGRARRVLTAFNGSGAAAVPALIKAATPVASLVSPATGKALVEDEDLHGVVWDSVRCVRTLAHVIRAVGHVEGESQAEIRSTLRDAVDDLDEVLKKIEEGTR